MRAVMLDAPQSLLEERRRQGLDVRDEVWDGVLHMVPPPASAHTLLAADLIAVLVPLARAHGLRVMTEGGIYSPTEGERDYRVPDIAVVAPASISRRGIEGRAELVIEILSPEDESRDKLPFYARMDVPEVWLVEPATRAVEVYVLRGNAYEPAVESGGAIRTPALGVELAVVDGPRLRLTWPGGAADV